MFPLFDERQYLVNVKVRKSVEDVDPKNWPASSRPVMDGEVFPLFPGVPRERDVVLCAGELDARALLSCGVPACSVTSGAGDWRDSYAAALAGKRVTVCFDAGEEASAEHAASKLRSARVHYWSGKPSGYDATQFLRDGGCAEALVS